MVNDENPTTVPYLRGIDYQQWVRTHFPSIRYNIITINIAESFNALARHV